MQVNATLSDLVATSAASSSRKRDEEDFSEALAAARQTDTGRLSAADSKAAKARKAAETDAATYAEFFEYMKKTPEQRMREAILREMNLTEEELAAMPPEERERIEAMIAQKIRDRIEAEKQEKIDAARKKLQAELRTSSIEMPTL